MADQQEADVNMQMEDDEGEMMGAPFHGAGPDHHDEGAFDDGDGEMAEAFLESVGGAQPVVAEVVSVVTDNYTLDLDAYAAQYNGHTKFDRLQFIASVCPSLACDALKLCLDGLHGGYNGRLERELTLELQKRSPPTQTVFVDMKRFEDILSRAALYREKLDNDLKSYRSNMVKESIRMGFFDLGDHYYNCGDLNNALKYYTRARDYCTVSKHLVNLCLNVIKVSIEMKSWSSVLNYVSKAESTPDVSKDANAMGQLKCCSALAQLALRSYKEAARLFLLVPFEHSNFPEIITSRDIAVYGGLCALASFDRQDLKRRVMENMDFKNFLELVPEVRELIKAFYYSRYAVILKNMEKIKGDLLLDLHLHPHVTALFCNIREKSLVQYFSPFLSVDMNKMAEAFSTDVKSLETELASLIMRKRIPARIDSDKKILYARQVDQRVSTFSATLDMGLQFEVQSKALLLRAAILQAGLTVASTRGGGRMMHRDRDHPIDM